MGVKGHSVCASLERWMVGVQAVLGSGSGRDINRHKYSEEEAQEALKQPVVQSLLDLCKFRNTHQAFMGQVCAPPPLPPPSPPLSSVPPAPSGHDCFDHIHMVSLLGCSLLLHSGIAFLRHVHSGSRGLAWTIHRMSFEPLFACSHACMCRDCCRSYHLGVICMCCLFTSTFALLLLGFLCMFR